VGSSGETASTGYSASFDTVGLPYTSAATSIPNQHQHPNRTSSVTYSAPSEILFSDHEQSLRSNGSAVDLTGYAYTDSGGSSIRRGSGSSSQTSSVTGVGSTLSNGQSYISADQTEDSTARAQVHHHHHHQQSPQHSDHHHQSHIATAVPGGTAATSYLSETPGGSGPGSVHAESRRATVGGRR
jgi:hypothetical protein